MSNNADYWRKRAEILKQSSEKLSDDYYKSAALEFDKAARRVQQDIDKWYARFAKNNEISYAEAKKWLTARELEELRWDVRDYIKAGESLDPKWRKAMENASARIHISRLEALKLQIQQQVEALYGNQAKGLDDLLRRVYENGYYRSLFEIQKGFNLGWEVQRLDTQTLDMVLKKPWTTDGRTFSDRVWGNRDRLVHALHTSLAQSIIRGESPDKAAAELARTMNVAKSSASRLINTEAAYFQEQAQKKVYEDLEVEKYEILETLDSRTCAVCGGLDRKLFQLSEYEPGITAPPFHPNCRGTTIPYFPDDEGERIARDVVTGETYYVPSNMTYEEWKNTYVKDDKIENRLTKKKMEVKVNLTGEEEYALNRYISSEAYTLNEKLRNGVELSAEDAEWVKNLDSALDKMPVYRGNLIRCVDIKDEETAQKFVEGLQVGKRRVFDEYISTSRNNDYNPNANILIYILNATKGRDISAYNPGEAEVLYTRGSEFKIIDRAEVDGKTYVLLEEWNE